MRMGSQLDDTRQACSDQQGHTGRMLRARATRGAGVARRSTDRESENENDERRLAWTTKTTKTRHAWTTKTRRRQEKNESKCQIESRMSKKSSIVLCPPVTATRTHIGPIGEAP